MSDDSLYNLVHEIRSELRAFRAEQSQRCKSHDDKTSEHHKTLYGNGTPGLKSRLEAIEVRAEMNDKDADRRTNMKLAIVSGVFAVVAAAIALLK